jgi:hypothetical protein
MFGEKLAEQFAQRKAEFDAALYRYRVLLRQLDKLEEDLTRMEAGLAEIERIKKAWDAQEAISQAQAK